MFIPTFRYSLLLATSITIFFVNSLGLTLTTDESDDQCAICLQNLDKTNNITLLSQCNHRYHTNCLREWKRRSDTCPLCKRSAVTIDEKQEMLQRILETQFSRNPCLSQDWKFQDQNQMHNVTQSESSLDSDSTNHTTRNFIKLFHINSDSRTNNNANKLFDTIIQWWTNFSNDYDVALAAVSRWPKTLRHASRELRDNKDIVMAAVQNDINSHTGSSPLNYASTRLRNDKDVVITAVKTNGEALYYASDDLKDDKEVVMTAIQNIDSNTNASDVLAYASKRLQGDLDVVLAAVQRGGEKALEFASEELRKDRTVIEAAKLYAMESDRNTNR